MAYGQGAHRFGDLRLPSGDGLFPLAVVIHGGCWRSENDLNHISHLSSALTTAGIATWTVEYRRVGDFGGGWPGTFEDVQSAFVNKALRLGNDVELIVLPAIGHFDLIAPGRAHGLWWNEPWATGAGGT